MLDERKYGVLVSKLDELKEFQLGLLKKRRKLIPNLRNIGYVQIRIFTNSGELNNQRAKLDVGNSKMFVETENGIKFEIHSKQIIGVCIDLNTIKIQFKPNCWFDYCLLKFPSGRIIGEFLNALPLLNFKTETNDENLQGN